jgi:predicted small secreted protein
MKISVMAAIAALLVLSACNTMQGFGDDVSDAGDSISSTANETQNDM